MTDSGRTHTRQPAELLQAGIAAAKAGKADQARRALLGALRIDRNIEQAWLWLSSVVQLPVQRRSCLEAVLRINPENLHARSGLELIAQQSRGRDSAPDACPRCKHTLPQTGTTCPACGLLVLVTCPACGQFGEATDVACPDCGEPLGDFHDGAVFHLELARAYVQRGRQLLAEEAIRLAEAAAPPNLAVLREVAALKEALGDTDGAIALWQRVIAADRDGAEPYARLGATYRRRSMPAEAREMYRLAAQRCQDDGETLFQLGELYYDEWGDCPEACELLERAVQSCPEHASAHALLGDIYSDQRQAQLAAKHYELAAEHAPQESILARESRRKLAQLRPAIPEQRAQGWPETLRRMAGLVLIPLLAAVLNAGLTPARVTLIVWGMLAAATVGSYLWACSTDVPRNPLIRSLFGPAGASAAWQKALLGVPGLLIWLSALAAILARL